MLLTSILLCFFFTMNLNAQLKASISGHLDTMFANVYQKNISSYEIVSNVNAKDNVSSRNIATNAQLRVNVRNKINSNLEYGGFVRLNVNSNQSKKEISSGVYDKNENVSEYIMAYLENDYGRFEVGNYLGAIELIKINARGFTKQIEKTNNDANYYWISKNEIDYLKINEDIFLETSNLISSELGAFNEKNMNSAKINYYTPEFLGFRFAATFIPNTNKFFYSTGHLFSGGQDIQNLKNIIETGISYTGEIKKVGLKVAAVSEFTKNKNNNNKNLRAYEVGTNISCQGLTLGGSYGDWSKCGFDRLDSEQYGKTNYWTAGFGYANGIFSASLTHLQGKKSVTKDNKLAHNKLRNTVLGVNYKLAPGVLPYVECSSFKMNHISESDVDDNNKGHIFMTGVKLHF